MIVVLKVTVTKYEEEIQKLMASISELKLLSEKKSEVKETPAPEPQPAAPGRATNTHTYILKNRLSDKSLALKTSSINM